LDRFNHRFNQLADRYREVIAWALDHRGAMVVIAVGSLVAAFTLPARGLTGMLVVVAGLVIGVVALTRRGLPRAVRVVGALAGLAVAVLLPTHVPAWGRVGAGFFPADDQSELNIAIETPPGSNLNYTTLKA